MADGLGLALSIERLYADGASDPDFAVVAGHAVGADDTILAEVIEADGRLRLARGHRVELRRYLSVVPDLRRRQDPLDAAIDVTLRSIAGSSRVTPQAVDELIHCYPDLEKPIREAAMLNAAIWSTTGLRAGVTPPPVKALPCDFGPVMSSGQRRYQLQRLLGQGGFGQVYLTLDRQLSEEGHTAMVAIKILSVGKRSPWARERLIEEATKVRRISHPNVVTVMDRGVTEQDEDYIVYEYVDGGDLSKLAAGRERIPVREAAALMAKIARGVHAAHSSGVIHCDLKPGNIMLTSTREPKVGDFGIAVRLGDRRDMLEQTGASRPLTTAGASLGGPVGNVAFISPEQYRADHEGFSIPSDVYALGGILFLLLTGVLPNGSTLQEIARTHDPKVGRIEPPFVRPIRPEVDHDLEAICRRAMSANPKDRYDSAATFSDDLERWLRLEPIMWNRPGVLRMLHLWARRKPALAAAVVLILLLLVTGSAVAMHLASVANQNALQAAMIKIKADSEEQFRLKSKTLAEGFAKSLRATLGDYRIATESLVKIWALEYVYGPKVLGLPDEQGELWKNRIANIRSLVQAANQDGRGEELETLLWESALAFWLVNAKDHAEAQPLLNDNIAKWSRRLAPADPWLRDLQTMQACAEVNQWAARAESGEAIAPAELSRIENTLIATCENLPDSHRGTPIHYMLLNSMIDLYGPKLLNQPARRESLSNQVKLLINHKPVETTCR